MCRCCILTSAVLGLEGRASCNCWRAGPQGLETCYVSITIAQGLSQRDTRRLVGWHARDHWVVVRLMLLILWFLFSNCNDAAVFQTMWQLCDNLAFPNAFGALGIHTQRLLPWVNLWQLNTVVFESWSHLSLTTCWVFDSVFLRDKLWLAIKFLFVLERPVP